MRSVHSLLSLDAFPRRFPLPLLPMTLRTLTAALLRAAARALASAMGLKRTAPANDIDGYEAWLDEHFAR